jgi:hypothetical protein
VPGTVHAVVPSGRTTIQALPDAHWHARSLGHGYGSDNSQLSAGTQTGTQTRPVAGPIELSFSSRSAQ